MDTTQTKERVHVLATELAEATTMFERASARLAEAIEAYIEACDDTLHAPTSKR